MSGGPGRTRTDDTRGVSAVLYQLSYRPLVSDRSQLRDGLPVRRQGPGLARPVDHPPSQAAGGVDEERAPERKAHVLVEDAVRACDLPVRPEVRQQGELVLLLLGPGALGVHRVAGDAHEL